MSQDDLTLALLLADRADAITRDRFGALDLHVDTKPDLTLLLAISPEVSEQRRAVRQSTMPFLRDRMEDIKKLMALQYDRRYAFTGESGMNDELYDSMMQAGWVNLGTGSDVKDITPELPKEAFAEIQKSG